MSDTTTMTVRLSKATLAKLDELAQSTQRSKSLLAAEAIAGYVESNAWQVEAIGKAVEKADRGGPFVRHEDAMAYLDALAEGDDPPMPASFRTR